MPYSATSLSVLRSLRDGGKFLLRGDRSHGCQIRYNAITKQREDRSALSLIPLERAGLIEFVSDPIDPVRYYGVKITIMGYAFLNENPELGSSQ